MRAIDVLLFIVLPYAGVLLFIVGTAERYRRHAYSCTSRSTQFLENRLHFWALVPFHAGILLILAGHLIGFLFPRAVLGWNAVPARLLALEALALTAGLLAFAGFSLAVVRRIRIRPVRFATGPLDWLVYAVLLGEIGAGVFVALRYSWGSTWYAGTLAPYLWSLLRLQPDIAFVSALPLPVQLHIAGAWLLLALFPFSSLVHVLAVPNAYLWRPPQVVRWHGRPVLHDVRHP